MWKLEIVTSSIRRNNNGDNMFKYSINSKEFDASVKEALKTVSDLRPAFIQIAREFYKANKAIFTLKSAGRYPDFKGPKVAATWKDPGLPEKRTRNGTMTAYQNYKQKKTGLPRGYPLLKFSGALEKSITQRNDANTVLEITKKSVVMGTRVAYAGFHQEGTKNIPMRKFLFLDPTTVGAPAAVISRRNEAWNKAINDYVVRVMKNIEKGGSNV